MGLKVVVDSSRLATLKSLILKLQDTPEIRSALSKGLNEHLMRQKASTITTVAAQTSMPKSMVERGTSVRPASAGNLEGAVKMVGGAVNAGQKTSRQWNKSMAGAKHGDWKTYSRKGGMMEHTFIAYGKIMRRKKRGPGSGRGPIEAVHGPVLPNEMVRRDMPNWPRAQAFVDGDLARRVVRALQMQLGF